VTGKRSEQASAAGTGREPVTFMGQMLRAIMMRWSDERVRLHAEVKRTGSVDANSVVRAAFDVAVRLQFSANGDPREIEGFVHELRVAFGEEVPAVEAVLLIRAALGEDVIVSDIGLREEIGAKVLTLVGIKDVLCWSEADVSAIMARAEQLARERGFKPTLAVQ
jgi:hypothetical protein